MRKRFKESAIISARKNAYLQPMRLLLLFVPLLSGLCDTTGLRRDFLLMFWNVENFFESSRHFSDKCAGIAKTIFLAGDEFGALPDLVGWPRSAAGPPCAN